MLHRTSTRGTGYSVASWCFQWPCQVYNFFCSMELNLSQRTLKTSQLRSSVKGPWRGSTRLYLIFRTSNLVRCCLRSRATESDSKAARSRALSVVDICSSSSNRSAGRIDQTELVEPLVSEEADRMLVWTLSHRFNGMSTTSSHDSFLILPCPMDEGLELTRYSLPPPPAATAGRVCEGFSSLSGASTGVQQKYILDR